MQFQNAIFPQNDSRMCQLNFIHSIGNRVMAIIVIKQSTRIKIKCMIIYFKKN
jgi:hypothetical protein